MKLKQQSNNEYFGRFEENEDIVTALQEVCEQENIQSGWFNIIGTVKSSEFAFFDQKERKYLTMTLEEEAEVLICTGNISMRDGKPLVHAHILMGDREGKAYGGHLLKGKVFVAEAHIKKFDQPVERKLDEGTGLALLEP